MIIRLQLTFVINGFRKSEWVVISNNSALPLLSGRKRRIVATYGLAHQVMSAVLRPEVPSAIAASEMRADIGSPDSTMNKIGVSPRVRPTEDNEKIFKLRNDLASGPWYTKLSSDNFWSFVRVSGPESDWHFLQDVEKCKTWFGSVFWRRAATPLLEKQR